MQKTKVQKQELAPKWINAFFIKDERTRMLQHVANIKHKCMIGLLYSSEPGSGELPGLKMDAIDSGRMLIHIKGAKGKKDRYTILSKTLLTDLHKYYLRHRPEN